MGWRGAVRSMAAAQRRAQRESVRRHKHLIQRAKEQAKADARTRAALEVEEYENVIERITSVHCDCGAAWNWKAIATVVPPERPERTSLHEDRANRSLRDYVPNFLDRVLRRGEKKRAALGNGVGKGRTQDESAYRESLAKFQREYSDWEDMNALATRILEGDIEAYGAALNDLAPFQELAELGSRVECGFKGRSAADVVIRVRGETVVPAEAKTLLQSGKASTKKMPQGRFFELYQDYVCGAILRVARELFAILPLDSVVVTAWANQLDAATGHLGDQAIVSVHVPRATLERLNFDALDPSDSLRLFSHAMDFKKTRGFLAIEPMRNDGGPNSAQ